MRIVRLLIKLGIIILVIGLLALACYALWLFLKSYWAPFLLFSYLTVGILMAVLFSIGLYIKARTPGREGLFLLVGTISVQSTVARLPMVLSRILSLLVLAAGGWLNFLSLGLYYRAVKSSGANLVQAVARGSLLGISHNMAPIALACVFIAYLVAWTWPSEIYWIRWFLVVQLLQTLLRHLSYATNPTSLPVQLRRMLGNAYVSFAVIVISDAAMFTLCFYGIFNWTSDNIVSGEGIIGVAKGILFASATDVFKTLYSGTQPSLQEMLSAGIGVLFGINLLESILKFKEFRRTDDDNAAIALNYCLIQRYSDAMIALEKVHAHSSNFYVLRAGTYIALARPDLGWEDIKRSVNQRENKQPTPEEILFELTGFCMFINIPLESMVVLLKYARDQNVRDVILANSIINSLWERPHSSLSADSFEAIATPDRPFCRVALLMASQKFGDAANELQRIKIEGLAENLIQRAWALMIGVSSPNTSRVQDIEYFSDWSSKNLDEFSHADWSSLSAPDLMLVWATTFRVYVFSSTFNSAFEQSWLYVCNEIKKKFPSNLLNPQAFDRMQNFLTPT